MSTPVRKPGRDTADMLTWQEVPYSPATASSAHRSHQPSDGISKVLHGGQITEEEALSLNKKKPCSGYKMKEITGSGIFAGEGNAEPEQQAGRVYQQAVNGISQISFSVDEHVTPKKPTSIPEVAKQRELSGTLQAELDSKTQKGVSKSKTRELCGNDIFGPPPEIVPRSVNAVETHEFKYSPKDSGEPAARNVRTSVKVSNPAGGQSKLLFAEDPVVKTSKKIHNQKFAELTGNDIFKGDVSPGSAEKPISTAKMREMSGSNIFADGKAASRDYLGGVRKPPGGESSISLV
ncbi:uncharacterized protein LOC126805112 [Argentina anserina]|uniref:uncharacterized protein LOC126805112 n=1 Tax=Argentina anserina TaxID=57926 RepID=UPI0021766C31|nr:uncharacterized protein LOC126805112 [Potentilla anserina]